MEVFAHILGVLPDLLDILDLAVDVLDAESGLLRNDGEDLELGA